MEEIASVFLEPSREKAVVPTDGVAIPAITVVGMVFTEGKVGCVREEMDVGVILEGTFVLPEVMEAEENSELFEVGPGVTSKVDVCRVIVVLGVVEDNNEENEPAFVEVAKETAGGEREEPLTDIDGISDIGPEVAMEGLFKPSRCAVLEDFVIAIVGVSETLLELKAVTRTGSEDIW